jgi:hypothetical protein
MFRSYGSLVEVRQGPKGLWVEMRERREASFPSWGAVYSSVGSHLTYSNIFVLRAKLEDKDFGDWESVRQYKFDCCKTRYEQPLDRIVKSCLVIAKHHLGDLIHISSDGTWDEDWRGTRSGVSRVFGKSKLEGVYFSSPPRDEVPSSALANALANVLAAAAP